MAYFDGLSLYCERFGQTYSYDSEDNLISSEDNQKQRSEFQYDADNNMTKIIDKKNNPFTFTYDNKHNVTKAVSPMNLQYRLTYDAHGNITKTGPVIPGQTSKGIWTERTYNEAGSKVVSVKDPQGNTVTYDWDEEKDLLTCLTDAKGNKIFYTYDADTDQLLSVTQKDAGGNTLATNIYDYENDRLKSIGHNGFHYQFAYDGYGNTTEASIAGDKVIRYIYEDDNGKLYKIIYGNGHEIRYVYDEQDRVKETYYRTGGNINASVTLPADANTIQKADEEVLLNSFVYGKDGNLAQVTDHFSGRTYDLEYDFLDRLMRVCDEEGNYYECEYDAENLLTRMVHANSGGRVATNFRYDKDGRETKTIIGERERLTSYDNLGRVVSQSWDIPKDAEAGATANSMVYGYPEADGNREASLPSYVENNAGRYEYTYNANGNITKIIFRSSETDVAAKAEGYKYDGLNQLIRENSKNQNKTFLYAYDAGGNLTSIKEYAYTTNTITDEIQPLRTYTGVYAGSAEAAAAGNNEVWKDQLLSWKVEDHQGDTPQILEDISMTYDSIGNMLTKGTRSFSWRQGRKLVGVTDGELNVSYEYDHTGNRVKKSVVTAQGATPVITTYCMAGDLLLSEQRGNDTIWYQYDSNANVVAMRLNGTRYFYVRNLQNDIVALTDRNGNVVVRYTYDAWGNEVSRTGTLADTVGVKNPFRYRGYYYDVETGMYYLKSRFYDPEIRRFLCADAINVLLVDPMRIYDKNLFLCCDNNPIIRRDKDGRLWITAVVAVVAKKIVVDKVIDFAIGAGCNVLSTLAVALITGQEYTLRDGIAAGIAGGLSGLGGKCSTLANSINAVYAGYVAYENGAEINDIILCSAVAYATSATFGNASEYVDKSIKVSYAAKIGMNLTINTGGNAIATSTNVAVTNQTSQKSTSSNSDSYRFLGYRSKYNGKTGAKMVMKMYILNKSGRVFYVVV